MSAKTLNSLVEISDNFTLCLQMRNSVNEYDDGVSVLYDYVIFSNVPLLFSCLEAIIIHKISRLPNNRYQCEQMVLLAGVIPDRLSSRVRGMTLQTIVANAIRWLDYISSSEGIEIQHSLNKYDERKIGGILVAGYCEMTKTVYQYQACFFHGCEVCFDDNSKHPLKGTIMFSVWIRRAEICTKIRSLGNTVVEMWEHEFLRRKKKRPESSIFPKSPFIAGSFEHQQFIL
ncbi:hypothetical protein HNY73_007488 [Argiope bruennichi]|uniref:Uncharacterized protein n=1 Tax=Argiope bruennichi TaxID=94029 RepID=A0A8T0FE34_ARGBR|nr:hypothetical protein HNY73_007488 [Argiope bruennichi]